MELGRRHFLRGLCYCLPKFGVTRLLFSFPRFSLLSIVGNHRRCLLLFRFSVETFAAHVYNSKRAKDKEKKSQKKYLSLFTKREGGVFLFRWEGKRKMFPEFEFF